MKKFNNSGFTIVELLVVIVIIGILAAITVVSYTGITKKANESALISDLDNNAKKLEFYRVENGLYPTSLNTSNCAATPKVDNNICLKASGSNVLAYIPDINGSSYKLNESNLSNKTIAMVTNNTAPAISQVVNSYIYAGSGVVSSLYTTLPPLLYFDFNEKIVPNIIPISYSSSLGTTYKISFTSGNLTGHSYLAVYSNPFCWDFNRNCIGFNSADLVNGNPAVDSAFDVLRKTE